MATSQRTPSRARPAEGRAPRVGTKRTVLSYILELPKFLQLLWGLITDQRVSKTDKLLVGGALAYVIMPADMIPDVIPFLGQVDDVYLLILAIRRLMRRAGSAVLLSHWTGDPERLRDVSLQKVLAAAAFFLPFRFRRRLKRKAND